MYVAYVVGLRYVPLLRARWVIATIVGVHVILLLSPPLSLTDVFNYINYGRMGMLHGLDPYTTIPALGPHSDPSYALSNWHQLLSSLRPPLHADHLRGGAARAGGLAVDASRPC